MPRRNCNARCATCPEPLPVRLIRQLNPLVDQEVDEQVAADRAAIRAFQARMHAEDMATIRDLLG